MQEQTIIITWPDHARLSALVDQQRYRRENVDASAFRRLAGELARAQLVAAEDTPPDVVTMNSQLRVRDLNSEESMTFTLSWPEMSSPENGRISVLAPMGMALLGCRIGQEVEWPVPGGLRRLCVEDVLYQPERRFPPRVA